MDVNNFSRYTSADIESLTEINPNAEFELIQHDKIKYVKGSNVLKRPDDFAEFLSKYPAIDKNLSVELNQHTENTSSAPGFQQYIKENYFGKLNRHLFKIGYDLKFHRYPLQKVKFDNFTNCCYPGMLAYQKNYLPHIDRFQFAANLYLTDCSTKTSTSFFRIKCSSGNVYHNNFELKYASEEDYSEIENTFQNNAANPYWEPWVFFRGNDFYDFYYEIPAEYNSVSMYRGNVWHSICYDSSPESKVRYSFVTAMFAE
tara:strand:- start:6 stop:779 length:774 start_codon:yes stop_codon:yes gene_type:complete